MCEKALSNDVGISQCDSLGHCLQAVLWGLTLRLTVFAQFDEGQLPPIIGSTYLL